MSKPLEDSSVVLPSVEVTDASSEKTPRPSSASDEDSKFNLLSHHDHTSGRLVIDPEEARIELGDNVAKRLKLSSDGTKVLWPQPTDNFEDPQNWTDRKKNIQLLIITLAAVVPGFDSGIGVASVFGTAKQFHTTPDRINTLTYNWSTFLLGWGGILAVILMRRYGRVPVLFWTQTLTVTWLGACIFVHDLTTYAALRCLTGFFSVCPQVIGLCVIADMFPFHLQARKLNIWVMGFMIAPFISPFLFGFLVARTSWRWAYGIGIFYGSIVMTLILLFTEETMYDRHLPVPKPFPESSNWIIRRHLLLSGITGAKMAKYRSGWKESILACLKVMWRPQLLGVLVFEAMMFGFSVGVTVKNELFLRSSPPAGYGFSNFAVAGVYGTPIVAVIIGAVFGRYFNDWVMNFCVRRNKGVFVSEFRLWTCYIAMPLYICGFVVLGASFKMQLSVGALVMGWGIAEVAVMLNTVAIYAYCSDSFPQMRGEVSALLNLARTLSAFSVGYFQVPWVNMSGAMQTFGVEAAIAAGLFLLVVPFLQLKGTYLREHFSL